MKLLKHLAIFFLLLATTVTFAQPGPKKERLKALKIGFFTEHLELTSAESERFWPIYNKFEADTKAIRKNKPKKSEIEGMNDAQLEQLLTDFFKHQDQEVNLKRQLAQDLKGQLPIRKIVKLQFVERQFKRELLHKIRNKQHRKGKKGNRPGPPMD